MSGKSLHSAKALAKLLGLTERRIQQLTKEGTIPAVSCAGSYGYELAPTVQAYIAYVKACSQSRGSSEREQALKQQKLEADINLKESQSELQRLKMDITAGKYIPVEKVRQDYARFFVSFKRFALAMPERLIRGMGLVSDPLEARRAEKELTGEVTKLLRSFVAAGVEEAAE